MEVVSDKDEKDTIQHGFCPKLRKPQLFDFIHKHCAELSIRWQTAMLNYGNDLFFMDLELSHEQLDAAKPILHIWSKSDALRCELPDVQNFLDRIESVDFKTSMIIYYNGGGLYVVPLHYDREYNLFHEAINDLTNRWYPLRSELLQTQIMMILPSSSQQDFKQVADKIKLLSEKNDFFVDVLKEGIVPKKLKPFNIGRFEGIYTNPNNSPNIILTVIDTSEKNDSNSSTGATNSASAGSSDNPAIAFLLGILSSKRPTTSLFKKMREDSAAENEIEMDKLPFFYIQYLLVDQKYRGTNMGMSAVSYILDTVANSFPVEQEKLVCEVEAKQSARGFWEKLGFKKLPGRPDDLDGVILGKTVQRVKRLMPQYKDATVIDLNSLDNDKLRDVFVDMISAHVCENWDNINWKKVEDTD